MLRFRVAVVSFLSLAVLAGPAGCKGSGKKKDGEGGGDGTSTASPSATPLRPLTADDLSPVIQEIGAAGVVPKGVVIELSTRAVDQDQVNTTASGKTVLEITPDTPGLLEWTGPSTLTFTPRGGFRFATKYTVRLKALETRTGVVAGDWTREFTTPPFEFVRAAPASIDYTRHRVNVDLTFSGPVAANTVRSYVTFSVDGQELGEARFSSTQSPNVVRATITSSRLGEDKNVRVRVRQGLPPDGSSDLRAAAAEDAFELFGGEPVDVKTAALKEGANGFFVEVVCDDKAAQGGQRYYWDYEAEDSYYVSRRCMLDEASAQEGIHFDPPVKFYVAPGSAGFRVFGDFKRGSYAMTLDAGLVSIDGGMTQAAFERSFSVPARKPAVGFVSNGRYLPRSAWRNLAITHLNVDQAELTIRHVPPENLVFWMSDEYRESTDDRTSNLVVRKTIPLKGAPDTQTTTWIDVGSWLPSDTKGVLELVLTASGANRASARLLLTEMSLIAKKSEADPKEPWKEEVRVWAMGMDDSNLLSGVEVKLVRKSGLTVARCATAGEDGCTLSAERPDQDDSTPFALIATKGGDLTYLKYSDLRTDVAESDVQGAPWLSEQPYRAAIWSDRGVYRPGETAHVAAVLRGRNDAAPDKAMPVEVNLIDPREKTVRKLVLETNEAGVVDTDLAFPAFADTGSWRVEMSVGGKSVGKYSFNVEEFVPERMKVTASTEKPGYAIDDSVPVSVDAKYLFGGSAEGSRVELTCRLEPSSFKPKENGNFTYGVWREDGEKAKTVTLGQVTGELDDKGNARLECPPLESGAGFLGAARVVGEVAVFEAGSGRSTNGATTAPVHPEKYYLGLATGAQKAERGKPFKVEGVVVDWTGKLAAAAASSVDVELYRLEAEYGYYYDEDEGDERYQRWLRPVREHKTTAAVSGGKFSIDVTPSDDNDGYVVRVMSGDARTDLRLEGTGRYYWSYNDRHVDQTPKPMKPTALVLTVPKLAKVGESMQVSVKAPYRGKILFTAETQKVVAAEWKKADAGEVTWSFKLKEFAPTVYVSAFLVKDPHLESKESFLPDRAFGVEPVAVEPTAYTQTVELTVPESVRSNSKLEVKLDLGKVDPGTYATVAAVDEGILSLTRFKSPDPIADIFAKRRLGVETFETVGWTMLLPPPSGPTRGTGGDAAAEGGQAGRVQPVKPVALWSGVVKVPDDGKLTVSFDVPQYRGALRVMAVTSGPKKLGRASKQVVVKDPIVLTTTLPRFVTLGDELQIPVFVTNLSGGKLDVTVSLAAENLPYPGLEQPADVGSPIQFLGKPEGRATLEEGKSTTMVFQARAIRAIGAAKFRVTAKGGGHESREELDVPFLPSGPKSRVVKRIPLEEGTLDLKPELAGWMPTSEKSTFWVTANPYGESFDHLKYLVRYPYGCIEQTTSSTRPLLFVGNFIGNVDPSLVADQKLDEMVMHGVNRVLSMQTPSGGFAYWPGSTEPSGWGTAYATHMLLDAQKAGYNVPQDRLDDVVAWIESEATRYENQGYDRQRWDWHGDTEAYLHYVLAISGKGRKARIQKLIDGVPAKSSEQQAEQRYMLQAALYLSGDRRYEKELKSPDVSNVKETRHNSWSFYSDRRRRGFMLSTFQDLFGSDPAGEELAQTVARALQGHTSGWYTTQELVWGITGLGKRVKDSAGDFSPPVLVANGKNVEPKANDKKSKGSDRTWGLIRASEYKSLALTVPDKGKGNLYLLLSSEGVKTVPDYKVGGEGVKIHRTWRDVAGNRVDPDALTLADLVYVEIEVTNETSEPIQNLALVDRLPAGFEIENPRLGRGGAIDWLDEENKWSPDYMNLRDDRIELFGGLKSGESKTFVYAARVVTAGSFTIPPIEIEAMYDPRIWAREDGRRITVSGPWKDFLL